MSIGIESRDTAVRIQKTRTGTGYRVFAGSIIHLMTLLADGSIKRIAHVGGGTPNWARAERMARVDNARFKKQRRFVQE